MTNRRQLQYNIPFFFTKCLEEKNSYRLGKNAVRPNFSFPFFARGCSPPLFPSPRINFTMLCYVQYREGPSLARRGRKLHTSTATRLGSAVDIQLSPAKGQRQLCTSLSSTLDKVFSIFSSFIAFSACFRVKGRLEKKTRADYIKRIYRRARSLANLWTAQLNLHFFFLFCCSCY